MHVFARVARQLQQAATAARRRLHFFCSWHRSLQSPCSMTIAQQHGTACCTQAMAQRLHDLTIFGATGFTGQHVVEEALRVVPPSLSICIAGRSSSKLAALAARLGASGSRLAVLGGVEVADPGSLQAMAQQTRMLLNCAGPFRSLGEPVFAAAAAAGTDYLDICGEPEFIERMAHVYGPAAAASGALMASAAGFDSIPADMGALFTADALAKAGAVPAAVEAVISVDAPLGTTIHYATWEAAVQGMASVGSLRALRREAAASGRMPPPPALLGRRPAAPEGPCWDGRLGRYTLPFPGADASIVRRTQAAVAALGGSPVHFSARFAAPSAYAAALFVVYGGLMMALCRWQWGRALLLRHPGLFSRRLVRHAGPSRQQMEATSTRLTLYGSGYSRPPPPGTAAGPPDVRVEACVSFGDPGYLFTSVILLQTALTLLEERPQLLAGVGGAGGVYTVGTLFRRSSLVQRLDAHGVKFAVVKQQQASHVAASGGSSTLAAHA